MHVTENHICKDTCCKKYDIHYMYGRAVKASLS